MRILHTSDWHLGRLFHNVHLTDDQAHVLEQFVTLAKESAVDAVIIAGDIYDRAVPPASAVELLDDTLSRLVMDVDVPTIVIAGNHDSPERLGFGARLLKQRGLHLTGPLASPLSVVTLADTHGPVEIFSIPYAMPEVVRKWAGNTEIRDHDAAMAALASSARGQRTKGHRSIVVGHAFVAGGATSESERLLSVGGAGEVQSGVFHDFDYVALGHLHRRQSVGGPRVHYCGSLLKYSFSEVDHTKSVTLVELDGEGQVSLEYIELSPRRDVRTVEGTLAEVLTGDASSDYMLARLTDQGPLLNPMAKLRDIYPNVLHIERPHFGALTNDQPTVSDHRKMTTLHLFESFWKHATSEDLDDVHRQVVVDTIAEIEGQSS